MIKHIWKKHIFIWCVLLVLIGVNTNAVLAEEEKKELVEDATSAIVVEMDTGEVLYNKNENEKLPPASMTKIMTMLLVMEALDNEKITLEDKVTASERAASMGGSQIFLEEGEQMTVHELLKGVAVASGNDASVALAEYIDGSVEKFVEKMNERAKELGLKNTNFQNTTGLPAKDHYTTANDLAVMSRELLKHEKILEYTSLYEDYLRKGTDKEFWLVNTNRLVKHYEGVDGLKTGYTKEAKYNLTSTAKRDGMRVITVLMGAETPKERNKLTTRLLDHAFANYEHAVLADKGEEMGYVSIEKGKTTNVPVTIEETAAAVVPKGNKLDEVERKIEIKDEVTAPVEKGTKVGVVQFFDGENMIAEKDLVLVEDAESASWFVLLKRTLSTLTGFGSANDK